MGLISSPACAVQRRKSYAQAGGRIRSLQLEDLTRIVSASLTFWILSISFSVNHVVSQSPSPSCAEGHAMPEFRENQLRDGKYVGKFYFNSFTRSAIKTLVFLPNRTQIA